MPPVAETERADLRAKRPRRTVRERREDEAQDQEARRQRRALAGVRLLQKLQNGQNKVARENPLGDFQFSVLSAVGALSPAATLNKVVELILRETGDIVDVAQTYVAMDRMTKKKGWMRETGKAAADKAKGRPMAQFAITEEGKTALREKVAHMQAMLAYQERMARGAGMTIVKVKPR